MSGTEIVVEAALFTAIVWAVVRATECYDRWANRERTKP